MSRVANGLGTVDPVLAERVRQAMAELAYSPSGTAQSGPASSTPAPGTSVTGCRSTIS